MDRTARRHQPEGEPAAGSTDGTRSSKTLYRWHKHTQKHARSRIFSSKSVWNCTRGSQKRHGGSLDFVNYQKQKQEYANLETGDSSGRNKKHHKQKRESTNSENKNHGKADGLQQFFPDGRQGLGLNAAGAMTRICLRI